MEVDMSMVLKTPMRTRKKESATAYRAMAQMRAAIAQSMARTSRAAEILKGRRERKPATTAMKVRITVAIKRLINVVWAKSGPRPWRAFVTAGSIIYNRDDFLKRRFK